MVVILPNKNDGLLELEKKFSWETFLKADYSTKEVELALPKFKLEVSTDMKETLIKVGKKINKNLHIFK